MHIPAIIQFGSSPFHPPSPQAAAGPPHCRGQPRPYHQTALRVTPSLMLISGRSKKRVPSPALAYVSAAVLLRPYFDLIPALTRWIKLPTAQLANGSLPLFSALTLCQRPEKKMGKRGIARNATHPCAYTSPTHSRRDGPRQRTIIRDASPMGHCVRAGRDAVPEPSCACLLHISWCETQEALNWCQ